MIKNSRPAKLVVCLDLRRLQIAPRSGIARYVEGLALGLNRLSKNSPHIVFRVACLGGLKWKKSIPAELLAETHNETHKGSVWFFPRFWPFFEKPRFIWSTLSLMVLRFYLNLLGRCQCRVVWIAPDNIDRPIMGPSLVWIGSGVRSVSVLQIVHDLIPVHYPRPENFFLRLQFELLLRYFYQNKVTVAGISSSSRKDILESYPKVSTSSVVLGPRLFPDFVVSLRACLGLRRSDIVVELDSGCPQLLQVMGKDSRFVLCVGRDEKYKNWGFAQEIFGSLSGSEGCGGRDPRAFLWMVHVCPFDSQSAKLSGSEEQLVVKVTEKVWVFPQIHMIRLFDVSDKTLVCLYRLADALVHPSLSEGYGFPLAESYLAGLPVFFGRNCGFSGVLELLGDSEAVHLFDDFEMAHWVSCLEGSGIFREDQFELRLERSMRRFKSEKVKKNIIEWDDVCEDVISIVASDLT